jgi:hypothetical protein
MYHLNGIRKRMRQTRKKLDYGHSYWPESVTSPYLGIWGSNEH